MADVKKVKKIKKIRSPAAGSQSGGSLDELVSDDLEELDELSDLDELEDIPSTPSSGASPSFPSSPPSKDEEPPISSQDRERMAAEALQESRREVQISKLEAESQGSGGKRKVRNPRAELFASLSVVIVTGLIASVIFGIAYQDYQGDAESAYDSDIAKAMADGNVWYFPDNRTITFDNTSGTITGKDAKNEYKEAFRMDGPYRRDIEMGPITIELNWMYYLVIGLLVLTGPNGVVRKNSFNKLKAKEGKFPDFIRDLAEFWKGGLSMKVAVDTLSKGDYGALDEEVEFMATQLSWGVSFNEVLQMFLDRVHTGLIERSVALIEEANRAGGKISDILLNVAHDAQEIKMLDRQREGTMKSYIFVTFISFLIYVIIIVIMSYVFLPAIADSTEDLDVEGGFGNVTIQSFDPTFIALLFFSSVMVQSIGGGVNAGIMGEGNLGASLWYITLFTITGAVIFQLAGVSLGLG